MGSTTAAARSACTHSLGMAGVTHTRGPRRAGLPSASSSRRCTTPPRSWACRRSWRAWAGLRRCGSALASWRGPAVASPKCQSAPRWQVRLVGIVVASGCPGLWLSCLPTDLLPTSDAGFYALVLHLGRQGCLGEVCRSEKTCMSCRRFGPVGRDDRCSECVGVGPCLCPCRPKSLATSTFGPKTQARHGLSPSHPCLAPPTR